MTESANSFAVSFAERAKDCLSLGRNGPIGTAGVHVTLIADRVLLEPIRANGLLGRCLIELPASAALGLAAALTYLHDKDHEDRGTKNHRKED